MYVRMYVGMYVYTYNHTNVIVIELRIGNFYVVLNPGRAKLPPNANLT